MPEGKHEAQSPASADTEKRDETWPDEGCLESGMNSRDNTEQPTKNKPDSTATTNATALSHSSVEHLGNNTDAAHQDQVLRGIPMPPPATRGRTLLPQPLATAVSTSVNTTSTLIRAGTWIGGLYISAGKYAVAKSVSGAQYLLRGSLGLAATEVSASSSSHLHHLESDHILSHTLAQLHYGLTKFAFWTIMGLNTYRGTLESTGSLVVSLLDQLNQFFGSTDSSRAIASIIDMVLREFRNPATGSPGEKVDASLLLVSLCSLAYLQNHCRKRREEREFHASLEELLWDVVVLDDGSRIDVDGLHVTYSSGHLPPPARREMLLDAIEQCRMEDGPDVEEALPEAALKRQIMRTLPYNASVDIATTTTITKTIAVEVKGTEVLPFEAPPGAEIVEQVRLDPPSSSSDSSSSQEPTFRVVYRFQKHSVGDTKIQGHGAYEDPVSREVEDVTDVYPDCREEKHVKASEEPPPEVPPKSPQHLQLLDGPMYPDGHADVSDPPTPATEKRTTMSPSPTSQRRAGQRPRPPHSRNTSTPPSRGRTPSFSKPTSASKAKTEPSMLPEPGDRKNGFRAALKRGPGSAISNLLHKESALSRASERSLERKQSASKKASQTDVPKRVLSGSRLPIPKRTSSASRTTISPHRKGVGRSIGRDARPYEFLDGAGASRPVSRASFISVHESKRDSIVSQTDTWSIHSRDGPGDDLRPLSPALVRKEVAAHSKIVKSSHSNDATPGDHAHLDNTGTVKSFCPTIYSLESRGSSTSLVLPTYQQSAFQDAVTMRRLQRTGMINETFPRYHLLRNVLRYMRFSSATYGSMFLSTMGIGKRLEKAWEAEGHLELNVFAHHTGIPRKDILMTSFVDTQGGTDATGSTNTNMPLIHYIAVDHDAKAIVLACRGTMGFEDVLADLMCEYDDLIWRRQPYRVHKGIHASARRILYGRDGRVLMKLKQALEEHDDYGLVLTGHSLGGGVTSLLGIMLAVPSPTGLGFVTSSQPHQRLLDDGRTVDTTKEHISLPSGRPIHVYTYGPPGTMAPRLQKATRGLITTVVHGNDLVPYLSLGILHDLQCVGLAFKSEAGGLVKDEVVSRIWDSCHAKLSRAWYGSPTYDTREGELRDDQKAVAALKTLRASMTNGKLVPPGEVFVVETSKVLRRDAYVVDNNAAHIGEIATRVVFKYIKDVEQRFREIRFGVHMLVDHSPARYEDALNRLCSGVAGPAVY